MNKRKAFWTHHTDRKDMRVFLCNMNTTLALDFGIGCYLCTAKSSSMSIDTPAQSLLLQHWPTY